MLGAMSDEKELSKVTNLLINCINSKHSISEAELYCFGFIVTRHSSSDVRGYKPSWNIWCYQPPTLLCKLTYFVPHSSRLLLSDLFRSCAILYIDLRVT